MHPSYINYDSIYGYLPKWGRASISSSPPPSPGNVFVSDGDSFYTYNINLGVVIGRRFDVGWGRNSVLCYDAASAGNTWSNMVLRGPTFVDPYYNSAPGSINIVLAGEWINECVLAGRTIAQAAVYAQQYYTARKAVGWYVYSWINQVTQYQDSADPVFQAWENADPGFANNSRWHADNVMDTNLSLYADAKMDLRNGGTIENQFYTPNAFSRWPALYIGGGTPAGQSHPNQYGMGRKADFVQPILVTNYSLPSATSVYNDQWANWPLWTESGSINYDYWCCGVNNLNQTADVTQNALSVTLGAAFFSSYLATSTSGGAETAHSLHASSSFSWGGWINISSIADLPTSAAAIGGVPGEYRAWIDQTAQKYKFTIYETDGGTTKTAISTKTPATGLHFFYFEVDGGNVSISVDNETKVSTAISSIFGGSANQFLLGYDAIAWKGIPGNYQNWFWYIRKLTDAERTYLYNSGTPRTSLFV